VHAIMSRSSMHEERAQQPAAGEPGGKNPEGMRRLLRPTRSECHKLWEPEPASTIEGWWDLHVTAPPNRFGTTTYDLAAMRPWRYDRRVPIQGEYEPSPWKVVADQVALYEATGGAEGGTLGDKPVVILSTRGRHSGKVRKTPLMRVEHNGAYAVVASMGGAPKHPVWYLNLIASPAVTLQDGANVYEMGARKVNGMRGRAGGRGLSTHGRRMRSTRPRRIDRSRWSSWSRSGNQPEPGAGRRASRSRAGR